MGFGYFNLPPTSGKSQSGMSLMWFAPLSWFDTIAVPTLSAAAGDTVKITGDHTFLTGKGFVQLPVNVRKSKLSGESYGDFGSAGVKTTGEIVIPGLREDVEEMLGNAINEDLIVLFQNSDCVNPKIKQIGCSCVGAVMTFKYDSDLLEGTKGSEYTVTLTGICESDFYSGVITELPA